MNDATACPQPHPAPLAMVKIAPDKSLPQTKNRGQRLTLTCHLRDIRHQPSLSGGQRMGDSHASERICRPKNLPITTDDMETELGRLRDTDIDDDSPVIRSKDRRRKLTDEWRPDRINHQLHRRHL